MCSLLSELNTVLIYVHLVFWWGGEEGRVHEIYSNITYSNLSSSMEVGSDPNTQC